MLEHVRAFCEKIAGPSLAPAIVSSLEEPRLDNCPTLHPYGFYMWKLKVPANPAFSLRLHAWLPEVRPRQEPDWPPHSHNADLYSFVLSGQVLNYVWDWHSCEDGDQALYEVGYNGNLSTLTKTKECGFLKGERVQSVGPSQDYLVPKQQFHATEAPLSASVVTLVLLSTTTTGKSLVVGDNWGDESYVFNRQDVDQSSATKAKKLALHCLVSLH